ncbi:50S ribosomal protein L4 [Striga asiatica]|uniref:50S ribosomal protein L4 n=1 Tax=Striga asiatica TaxID=4170 RepID=A0A5A7RDH8_STRAF|nr:50S ribosomal protein L4 [Striga asiatica]
MFSNRHEKSGNEQFCTELSKWIFHERSHLKVNHDDRTGKARGFWHQDLQKGRRFLPRVTLYVGDIDEERSRYVRQTLPMTHDGTPKECSLAQLLTRQGSYDREGVGIAHPNCLFLLFIKVCLSKLQGSHSTKTKSEVSGIRRKTWWQKGTERARHETLFAPHVPLFCLDISCPTPETSLLNLVCPDISWNWPYNAVNMNILYVRMKKLLLIVEFPLWSKEKSKLRWPAASDSGSNFGRLMLSVGELTFRLNLETSIFAVYTTNGIISRILYHVVVLGYLTAQMRISKVRDLAVDTG